MTPEQLLIKFCDACVEALDTFNQEWDEYELENDGESPDWPSPILYFDGTNVRYFDDGDASMDANTQKFIRIGADAFDRMNENEPLEWITEEMQTHGLID
jgi:hypothetical protein